MNYELVVLLCRMAIHIASLHLFPLFLEVLA